MEKLSSLLSNPILKDYYTVVLSRRVSLIGRQEIFRGRAKFGIFGSGKELPQVALAKVFKAGDFRAGYYRDQTFMFAAGMLKVEEFFAQLYAHTDLDYDPCSGGRCMNGHFSTQNFSATGDWNNLTRQKNSSSDVSATAGQIARLVGLGYASKLYRQNPDLHDLSQFSDRGNEIAFGTIGDASCAQGVFWEAVNAMGILQIPVILSVWDDGYGISVPTEQQITKNDIGGVLSGFEYENGKGVKIYSVNGYDYPALCRVYREAEELCRKSHIPVVIHVKNLTQPIGHSSSGSHERYKSEERLQWEKDMDGILHFRNWILGEKIADTETLDFIYKQAEAEAKQKTKQAWLAFKNSVDEDKKKLINLVSILEEKYTEPLFQKLASDLQKTNSLWRSTNLRLVRKTLMQLRKKEEYLSSALSNWLAEENSKAEERYSSHLYCETKYSALKVPVIKAKYSNESPELPGYQILNTFFEKALKQYKTLFAIGEDVGVLGGVNQCFMNLQNLYGDLRVSDTGIREATILGQGVGAALRGLRPIIEIQYLDYIFYAMFGLTDDVATTSYRTKGRQSLPLIIRTRGHRFEGIWHSGSPLGALIHSLRGIYILVPRNMVQAAGLYNTMLQSNDPALLIECLNGYRYKEKLPDNLGEYTVPLGVPEILRSGADITIVTYGALCHLTLEATNFLDTLAISCEVIDVQTLLPFDREHVILKSVQKTSRLLIVDEDVPGGASGYILDQVLNKQNAYEYLDSQPLTLSSKAHRPAYSTDGNYFSKPNLEDIIETVYKIMHEANPSNYP